MKSTGRSALSNDISKCRLFFRIVIAVLCASSFARPVHAAQSKCIAAIVAEDSQVIEICTKEIKRNPKIAILYVARADAFRAAGRADEQIKDLDTAIRLKPDLLDALMARAEYFYTRKDYDRALKEIDTALATTKSAYLFMRRADVQHQLGKFREAVASIDVGLSLDPGQLTSSMYFVRALAYEALDEFDRSIQDYTSALQFDPKDASAYTNRGVAHRRAGNCKAAIEDYNQSIALKPSRSAYQNRANCNRILKDFISVFADEEKASAFPGETPQSPNAAAASTGDIVAKCKKAGVCTSAAAKFTSPATLVIFDLEDPAPSGCSVGVAIFTTRNMTGMSLELLSFDKQMQISKSAQITFEGAENARVVKFPAADGSCSSVGSFFLSSATCKSGSGDDADCLDDVAVVSKMPIQISKSTYASDALLHSCKKAGVCTSDTWNYSSPAKLAFFDQDDRRDGECKVNVAVFTNEKTKSISLEFAAYNLAIENEKITKLEVDTADRFRLASVRLAESGCSSISSVLLFSAKCKRTSGEEAECLGEIELTSKTAVSIQK